MMGDGCLLVNLSLFRSCDCGDGAEMSCERSFLLLSLAATGLVRQHRLIECSLSGVKRPGDSAELHDGPAAGCVFCHILLKRFNCKHALALN